MLAGARGRGWLMMVPLLCAELRDGVLVAGDGIKDSLDEDDADVNAPGEVRKKLGDEVVDRVGGVSEHDAADRRGTVAIDAGNVQVADFRGDGVRQQAGEVGHGGAGVTLRNGGVGDGVKHSAEDARVWHAVIVRVFVGDRGDEECAESLAGRILQQAVAGIPGEADAARAVGGVRVDSDVEGGDVGDGSQVAGVGEIADCEAGFLRWTERDRGGVVEEADVRVRRGDAGFAGTVGAVHIRAAIEDGAGAAGQGEDGGELGRAGGAGGHGQRRQGEAGR